LRFFWVSLLLSLLHSFFQSTLLLHTLIIQLSSSRSWVFQTIFLWKNYNNLIIILILIIFLPVCVCVCVSDFYVFCKLGLSLFCLPSSLSIKHTPDFLSPRKDKLPTNQLFLFWTPFYTKFILVDVTVDVVVFVVVSMHFLFVYECINFFFAYQILWIF
jgi:hypothetical protein